MNPLKSYEGSTQLRLATTESLPPSPSFLTKRTIASILISIAVFLLFFTWRNVPLPHSLIYSASIVGTIRVITAIIHRNYRPKRKEEW